MTLLQQELPVEEAETKAPASINRRDLVFLADNEKPQIALVTGNPAVNRINVIHIGYRFDVPEHSPVVPKIQTWDINKVFKVSDNAKIWSNWNKTNRGLWVEGDKTDSTFLCICPLSHDIGSAFYLKNVKRGASNVYEANIWLYVGKKFTSMWKQTEPDITAWDHVVDKYRYKLNPKEVTGGASITAIQDMLAIGSMQEYNLNKIL